MKTRIHTHSHTDTYFQHLPLSRCGDKDEVRVYIHIDRERESCLRHAATRAASRTNGRLGGGARADQCSLGASPPAVARARAPPGRACAAQTSGSVARLLHSAKGRRRRCCAQGIPFVSVQPYKRPCVVVPYIYRQYTVKGDKSSIEKCCHACAAISDHNAERAISVIIHTHIYINTRDVLSRVHPV